ncbi:ATP-binding protein [Streptomyces sp. NPDC059761]|uniref:ATP-binding protein n=1 Tax=Streptomyces sp. NPDC059761 TaxID=3346937 RepID=UPI00365A5C15
MHSLFTSANELGCFEPLRPPKPHKPFSAPPSRMGRLRLVRYARPYAGTADSVPTARQDLETAAGKAGLDADLIDSALLCLTELTANAVRHAIGDLPRPRFTVVVRLVGQRRRYLRLEVHDPDHESEPAFPSKEHAPEILLDMDPDRSTGRGLALVAALSERAGVLREDGGYGKTVWCEFLLEPVGASDAPTVSQSA